MDRHPNDQEPALKWVKLSDSDIEDLQTDNPLVQFVLDNPYNKHDAEYETRIETALRQMEDLTSVNNLNAQGDSALHLAVRTNNSVMVEQLLKHLKDINVDTKNREGETAI